jgi:hypothetical protein
MNQLSLTPDQLVVYQERKNWLDNRFKELCVNWFMTEGKSHKFIMHISIVDPITNNRHSRKIRDIKRERLTSELYNKDIKIKLDPPSIYKPYQKHAETQTCEEMETNLKKLQETIGQKSFELALKKTMIEQELMDLQFTKHHNCDRLLNDLSKITNDNIELQSKITDLENINKELNEKNVSLNKEMIDSKVRVIKASDAKLFLSTLSEMKKISTNFDTTTFNFEYIKYKKCVEVLSKMSTSNSFTMILSTFEFCIMEMHKLCQAYEMKMKYLINIVGETVIKK